MSDINVDQINDLAQYIRQVNGNNDMGAAKLAESILEWQAARTQPTQTVAAWLCTERNGALTSVTTSEHEMQTYAKQGRTIEPLVIARPQHNAPDELQESGEAVAYAAVNGSDPSRIAGLCTTPEIAEINAQRIGGDVRPLVFGDTHPAPSQAVRSGVGVPEALKDARHHLKNWLEQDLCECEHGCNCGRAQVAKTVDDIEAMLTADPTAPAVQGGGVPEGWKVVRMPKLQKAIMTGPVIGVWGPNDETITVISDSDDRRERNLYALLDALLTNPTPATTPQPADPWIKCSERLPTKVDADPWGAVHVMDGRDCNLPLRTHWGNVKRFLSEHPDAIWTPTGLKRPNPPAEGEEE